MSDRDPGEVSGFYLRPLHIAPRGRADADALPLAGGPLAFAACEVSRRGSSSRVAREVVPAADLVERLGARDSASRSVGEAMLERLTSPRPPFAGLPLDKPQVMAVVNVTPDSFSDGGDRFDPGRAVEDGLAMLDAGAAILDVGGESTRPGAAPVPREEELRRVLPVVRGLAGRGAVVSIDTRRARVMAEALEAGATLVNDVTALTGDPDSLDWVARSKVPVVLMHMQGEPRTMQSNPTYDDVALDVFDVLAGRVAACEDAGIPRSRIAVDPGIGFGKSLDHNLEILEQLALYHGLGTPVLLGVSRKSFIGRLSDNPPPKKRVPGSLAAALSGVQRGAQMIRVHDVAETVQALEVWQAIAAAQPTNEPRATAARA